MSYHIKYENQYLYIIVIYDSLISGRQNPVCFLLRSLLSSSAAQRIPNRWTSVFCGIDFLSQKPAIISNQWKFRWGFFLQKTKKKHHVHFLGGGNNVEIFHGLIGGSRCFQGEMVVHQEVQIQTYRQVVHFLIDAKADLELTTTQGNTPLHHAAEENFSAACGYLFGMWSRCCVFGDGWGEASVVCCVWGTGVVVAWVLVVFFCVFLPGWQDKVVFSWLICLLDKNHWENSPFLPGTLNNHIFYGCFLIGWCQTFTWVPGRCVIDALLVDVFPFQSGIFRFQLFV